jgi:predicted amidohydrolase
MALAKDERVFLITGANYLQTDGGVRIRSTLFDPEGRTVGWQDKVHLFHEERNLAVAGREYGLLETALGKVGITVCYDNVFPEAARSLALRGADMLFVPSRITSEGLDPWLLYLKTRALENRIPIIAPNIFASPKYPGGSVIIDLKQTTHASPVILPEIIASAGAGEKVIVAEINIDQARHLRLKRLAERMPEAYR